MYFDSDDDESNDSCFDYSSFGESVALDPRLVDFLSAQHKDPEPEYAFYEGNYDMDLSRLPVVAFDPDLFRIVDSRLAEYIDGVSDWMELRDLVITWLKTSSRVFSCHWTSFVEYQEETTLREVSFEETYLMSEVPQYGEVNPVIKELHKGYPEVDVAFEEVGHLRQDGIILKFKVPVRLSEDRVVQTLLRLGNNVVSYGERDLRTFRGLIPNNFQKISRICQGGVPIPLQIYILRNTISSNDVVPVELFTYSTGPRPPDIVVSRPVCLEWLLRMTPDSMVPKHLGANFDFSNRSWKGLRKRLGVGFVEEADSSLRRMFSGQAFQTLRFVGPRKYLELFKLFMLFPCTMDKVSDIAFDHGCSRKDVYELLFRWWVCSSSSLAGLLL
jgi:hypothetical protein